MTFNTRRQFILINNKWQVRTIRSRRRERILRDLWECVVEGGKLAGDYGDDALLRTLSAQNENVDNDISSIPLRNDINVDNDQSEGYQFVSDEVDVSQDEIDNVKHGQTPEHTQDGANIPNDSFPLDTSPTLHLGSTTKTWLDFGSDQYNFVGEKQCLPLMICAPGSCEDDPDTAVYFNVEIRCSETETGLSFWLQKDLMQQSCSSIKITMKEGDSRCVYVTWTPLRRGGLRESICVTTTFNGTQDLVATNEIIAVGCARGEDSDYGSRFEQEASLINEASAAPDVNQKHHDLAQSPFEQQTNDDEIFDNIDADGPHELSMIDEEGSQNDLEQSIDEGAVEPDSRSTSDAHQNESHDPDQKENETDEQKSPDDDNGNKTPKKRISLTFTLKARHEAKVNISSATNVRSPMRHHQRQRERQQLRNSIEKKVAKIRAQHATNNLSAHRDNRGRPIRSTHPSATSFNGLSNRAKLMRSVRQARMNKAEQNLAAVESGQTIDSTLKDKQGVIVKEKSEPLADEFVGSCEDANGSEHEETVVVKSLTESSTAQKDIHMKSIECDGGDSSHLTDDQCFVGAANEEANATMITNSSDTECQEETKLNNTSSSDQQECHFGSSSHLNSKEDATDSKFDSPPTKTIANVSVEVDETATLGAPDGSDGRDEVNQEMTSTLADEISDMEDYLITPRSVSAADEDSKVDATIDVGDDVSSKQISSDGIKNQSPSKNEVFSTDKPKVFTFEQDASPITTQGYNERTQSKDEQMISPEALLTSKSYENTTNELNQMMAEDQPVLTKRHNTPLKDLHDQINHIINQKSVSPPKKNKELTPEPNHVVPLKIDGKPLVLPPSKARQTIPSTKSKTSSSVIRKSMYEDTQSSQSSRTSARKSARQLYFYKSPKNADIRLVKSDEKSTSQRKGEEDKSKISTSDNASTLQQVPSTAAKRHAKTASATLSDTKIKSVKSRNESAGVLSQEQDSSYVSDVKVMRETADKTVSAAPSQPSRAKTGHESDYKSRIQSIRENRSNGSLQNLLTKDAPAPSSDEKAHHPPTAKSAARKLYFYKSPSAEPLSVSGSKARERGHRVSDPLPEIAVSNYTPSAPKAKSFVTSPPTPTLSPREQIAIEKHIHSMRKSKANQKSII